MGCTNSKVCPLPMGLVVETPQTRRRTPKGRSLLAALRNVFNKRNKVVPINDCEFDDDIDQPSTSYPRDDTINAQEFLAFERFLVGVALYSDSDSDDDDVRQKQPSMSYPPGRVKESYDILVIDHPTDEMTAVDSPITEFKTRPGGVAFEVADNFDPIAEVADIKVSRGGVAFEITTNQYPAASAKSDVTPEMSLPSRPITSISCTRHAKEGVAFEIDFSDNEEEKRQLTTLSKVTSLMAANGWSERDVIKEADDVWVANKVLAMKDNAKKNEEHLASLKKADLEFDLMTATMTEWNLQGFHYILVKESSAEHSLIRQAQFQAWKKNLREGFD